LIEFTFSPTSGCYHRAHNTNKGARVERLRQLVESHGFRSTILLLIVLNAFAMGLEATPGAVDKYDTLLDWVFLVSQVVFVAEIAARLLVARGQFFRDSWNVFDFVVVALSLTPAVGDFALIARIFRILRVLRIVSVSEVLLGSLLRQDAGLRATLLATFLIAISGYIFALSGFHLFGDELPEWGSLADSTATLAGSFTPGGLAAAIGNGGAVLAFHIAFHAVILSTVVNLVVSLTRTFRGAAS
jgi:voltage-gated sodium channel